MTFPRSFTALTGAAFASFALGAAALPASAHAHRPASAATRTLEYERHLHRLAAQEKQAWREHVAKVLSLPRRKKLAMIRHDHRLKRLSVSEHDQRQAHLQRLAEQEKAAWHVHLAKLHVRELHDQRLAAHQTNHEHLVDLQHLAAREKAAWRLHLAKLHLREQHEQQIASKSAHATRIADAQSHHRKPAALSGHEQRLAALQAHDQRLAALQAHEQKLEKLAQAKQHQALTAHQERVLEAAARMSRRALAVEARNRRTIIPWSVIADGIPVKCITINLNNPQVKVSALLAIHGDGTAEPFLHMIDRADPNVAVTGTFFSLSNMQPVGDIVVDGSLIHFGGMGTALCITPENQARMVECQWGRHHDWSPYDFVVACGPRLLTRGRISLDPVAQRFHDKHMFSPNSRIAVGITRGNKLVFVMTREPIYLDRLAHVMRDVGAYNAMNLDAGESAGFYCNGDIMARPGRRLTNLIVVYDRRYDYDRSLPQLVPGVYRRMSRSYPSHRLYTRASPNPTLTASRRES